MFAGGKVSQQPEATVDGEGVFLTFYSLSTPTNQSPLLCFSDYACAALLSFFFLIIYIFFTELIYLF